MIEAPFYNYDSQKGYYKPTLQEFNNSRITAGLKPVKSFDDPEGKAPPQSAEKIAMWEAIDKYLVSEGWEENGYERGWYSHPILHLDAECEIITALNLQLGV
jgi:hypothetical protein